MQELFREYSLDVINEILFYLKNFNRKFLNVY